MILAFGSDGPCWSASEKCDTSILDQLNHSLGEVGEVLDDLGDECQCPGCAVIRILLHQIEERWRHDSRAQEAQEERCADETLTNVLLVATSNALLLPRCKHLL